MMVTGTSKIVAETRPTIQRLMNVVKMIHLEKSECVWEFHTKIFSANSPTKKCEDRQKWWSFSYWFLYKLLRNCNKVCWSISIHVTWFWAVEINKAKILYVVSWVQECHQRQPQVLTDTGENGQKWTRVFSSHTRRSDASEKREENSVVALRSLLIIFACGKVSSPRLYRLRKGKYIKLKKSICRT